MNDEPSFILGRALASWGNPPRWHAPDTTCTRQNAEHEFTKFIEECCANWGLATVSVGVLQEIEADHNGD